MNKYLYKIKDLEIPTHLKYWFARKSKVNFDLSEILNGSSFDLTNTVNKKLHLINIFGNSIQNGEPTPENTIEIKSSGDNGYIVEKFVNKNLYLGNAKQSSATRLGVVSFKIKPNTTYTLNSSNNSIQVINYYQDNNKDNIINTNWQTLPYTFTTPANCYYLAQLLRNSNNSNIALTDLTNYQIEEGSVATDYEPHQEQLYTIPCQQPMRAIGDVKDTFVKVDGVWYERHYIARKIFNGTESFGLETSLGYTRFNYTVSNIIVPATSGRVIGNTASNYFRESITNDYGIIIQVQTRVAFYPDASITTVAEFKAWVSGRYNANKPLYLDYVMDDYTDLPCTQTQITALENLQKARTYKDVTHIYTDDEVPADLQIQYYKEKGE